MANIMERLSMCGSLKHLIVKLFNTVKYKYRIDFCTMELSSLLSFEMKAIEELAKTRDYMRAQRADETKISEIVKNILKRYDLLNDIFNHHSFNHFTCMSTNEEEYNLMRLFQDFEEVTVEKVFPPERNLEDECTPIKRCCTREEIINLSFENENLKAQLLAVERRILSEREHFENEKNSMRKKLADYSLRCIEYDSQLADYKKITQKLMPEQQKYSDIKIRKME